MKHLTPIFIISLLLLGAIFVMFSAPSHASTENIAYKYYKEIDFSNATAGPQVFSFLIYNGTGNDTGSEIFVNCSNFPADIRFVTSLDNTTYLPQYIEHTIDVANNRIVYTNPVRIYVRVPSLTQKIYLLYDNPNATLYSAGSAVFTYFDDFSNHTRLLNDYNILQNAGAVTQNTTLGFVDIREMDGSQETSGIVYKSASFNPVEDGNKKITMYVKFSLVTDTRPYPYGRFGFINTATPTYSNPGLQLNMLPSAYSTNKLVAVSGSATDISNPGIVASSANWYDVKMTYYESGSEWFWFAKNAQSFSYLYNASNKASNTAWYVAAIIPMYASQTYEFSIDFIAVDVSYTQNIQLNVTGAQLTNPPAAPDPSGGTSGGAGSLPLVTDPPDPSHAISYFNQLIAFTKTHLYLVGIAIVVVMALLVLRRL